MEKKQAVTGIQAVVFDLDGTLVDSLEDIAFAVNTTLTAHGRQAHSLDAYQTMVGWGLKKLLVTASADSPFSGPEFDGVYRELLTLYRSRPVVATRAYPGIEGLLDGLKSRASLGVLSNKEDGMTKIIVSTLFPQTGFRAVCGSVADRPHKPDPTVLREMLNEWGVAPRACAYLGDSDVDMETAVRAGVVACGASWGFRGAEELIRAGADEVFPHPDDFRAWLERRLERN
ncbi:MAG TPA: HAD family hydrolase [Spirochaetia bacterium]|jgi:phosphoglycolate phosphatase|nr:HAD family hydrolase [Spirochaetia bacterium]